MTTTLVDSIGLLVTHDDERPPRENAAIVIENGVVAWVGDASEAPAADERIDADGGCVIPGFVDSHSHPVFAGDRADEFEARMGGTRYEAGGIQRTVRLTREATDEQLLANATRLVAEARAQGTTTIEIKSGYGLTVADEERSVRLASTLTPEVTFLGGHVVPQGSDRDEYVALVTGEMLDACAPHAKWIDVFCEAGAFTVDESRAILTAGIARGLGARVHAGQLAEAGGVALAVELGAASVDHCTFLSREDVDLLAGGETVATLLPGVEFSTRQPYPDARRLIDAGVPIAISTDCNPGSSYTTSMALCIALAVREMGMTPLEALTAATAGGAAALRRTDVGHLRVGAKADLVVLAAPTYVHLAYRPGVPLVRRVLAADLV
ncbi:imidazolonepropionase [Salinibacterium sp. G-O1]|uniref:imidazolonepropionase n=1 Tax=Salinibacterium sp. G-O1 TaxID=3046208 RepID=UPI0024B8F006|nr:imidazolonepropionase [Salinibacterium sp. G-O1]MDJ0334146.1 imidazolonepropionase [Salinibacterium sp. G-O1]